MTKNKITNNTNNEKVVKNKNDENMSAVSFKAKSAINNQNENEKEVIIREDKQY